MQILVKVLQREECKYSNKIRTLFSNIWFPDLYQDVEHNDKLSYSHHCHFYLISLDTLTYDKGQETENLKTENLKKTKQKQKSSSFIEVIWFANECKIVSRQQIQWYTFHGELGEFFGKPGSQYWQKILTKFGVWLPRTLCGPPSTEENCVVSIYGVGHERGYFESTLHKRENFVVLFSFFIEWTAKGKGR